MAPGRHLTHWSSKDRARQAVEDGSGSALSARSIRTLLNAVDLPPHRTRYWKTARWDAEFKQRAEKILWGAAREDDLGGGGGGWRSRFTPVPASWRDQAELLLDAFADRSLKRGSWCSRADFGVPGEHAWPEDNRLDAHPFEGTWTNPKLRRWFADHEP